MSLFEEKKGNIVQEFFQAGKRKLYLRNKNKPESIHIEHALDSLNYLEKRNLRYSELENNIVMMLPQEYKDQYLSKRIPELIKLTNNYISSLSDPELQKKYKKDSKEYKTAEDQTRYRQQINIKDIDVIGLEDTILQDSSVMMMLPNKLIKKYSLKEKAKGKDFSFVFVDTDKGIMLIPLDDILLGADNIADMIGFFKISDNMTKEDLKILLKDND